VTQARVLLTLLLPLLASACFWGGSGGLDEVDDRDVIAFADHIRTFYEELAELPLDSRMTYENRRLRAFFVGDREFNDYYAALANNVRDKQFRHGSARRVEIDEFRFDAAGHAQVDVTFVGRNQRILRFWEIRFRQTDAWERIDGRWIVNPEKL
jgi:hypothetical protein